MDLENTQNNSLAKLPLLKQGEYDTWRLRIESYIQLQDYALWEIIEEGNSFKPVARTTTNEDGTSTTTIPGAVTAEQKILKKNDLKARSILMMTLPSEHLLTFNKHKDAKSLFEAIEARFGGNEATKKTQKTLLKQMYETFNASSSESLDSIFNRLQKIVSQLTILGEIITPEELNLKFLRSLPTEWGMHVVVWRNKSDLGSISFDDLYNNFKIVEPEVKRSVISSSNSGSQNLAFLSGHSSTNDVNTANVHVSTGSTPVSTASTNNSTACLSDATVYAYLATQPNGSQVVHEDLEQIHEDDLDEMDLKWQLALLSMKARKFYQRTGKKIIINGSDTAGYDKKKVECFNCHKLGHFARECRNPRSQENRNRSQDSSRRTVNVEESSSKAMLAIDGTGFDWSYMADEEASTNFALMAFSDSESGSIDCKLQITDKNKYFRRFKQGGWRRAGRVRSLMNGWREVVVCYRVETVDGRAGGDYQASMVSLLYRCKQRDQQGTWMIQKSVLNNVKEGTANQRGNRPSLGPIQSVNHQKLFNSREFLLQQSFNQVPWPRYQFSTARQSFSRTTTPVSECQLAVKDRSKDSESSRFYKSIWKWSSLFVIRWYINTYPLKKEILEKMINLKIEAEEESTMVNHKFRGGLLEIKELLQNNAAEELSTVS
ncbi:putative ribonuclease H-like domain-containing protein [Tanacetum coccineum]